MKKSPEEWRKLLSKEAYKVLREKGTELPFSGKYNRFFEKGIYHCAACGQSLFHSDSKFPSESGWPSFSEVIDTSAIVEQPDFSHQMQRTEVFCSACESHLGHVFSGGPKPGGRYFCINSVALDFKPKAD